MVGMARSKVSAAGPAADTGTSGRTAKRHLEVAAVAGVVGAVVMGLVGGWEFAALVGWDVMAGVLVVLIWVTIWPQDAHDTARLAAREDPTRTATDLLLIAASVASLIGVAFVIVAAGNRSGVAKGLLVSLAVVTVSLSWSVVHTTYTLQYARLFYSGNAGGLNFHQRPEGQPQYSDFAYVALTVGMTFQVSDTEVNSTVMRATILRQALLAYLFGVVIIAIVINVVAGLTK
jgi:uncharacterized membrane protein